MVVAALKDPNVIGKHVQDDCSLIVGYDVLFVKVHHFKILLAHGVYLFGIDVF